MNRVVLLSAVLGILLLAIGYRPVTAAPPQPVVHILYFYLIDCSHCKAVEQDVLKPLQAKHGTAIEVRMLEISIAANYELLIRAEETFAVRASERGIPTLIVGDKILIGEDAIRRELPGIVERGLAQGGIDWPKIPGLDPLKIGAGQDAPTGDAPPCPPETPVTCAAASPIWVAYFYQVGCQKCSRAEADIRYLPSGSSELG